MPFHNTAASSYKVCKKNVVVLFKDFASQMVMLFHNKAASRYKVNGYKML